MKNSLDNKCFYRTYREMTESSPFSKASPEVLRLIRVFRKWLGRRGWLFHWWSSPRYDGVESWWYYGLVLDKEDRRNGICCKKRIDDLENFAQNGDLQLCLTATQFMIIKHIMVKEGYIGQESLYNSEPKLTKAKAGPNE